MQPHLESLRNSGVHASVQILSQFAADDRGRIISYDGRQIWPSPGRATLSATPIMATGSSSRVKRLRLIYLIGLGYGVFSCVTRARLGRRCSAQLRIVGFELIDALRVVAVGHARGMHFLGPA